MVRMDVYETLVPNDGKGLTDQVADLPSDIFIWIIEDRDWPSRIDGRRQRWVDSLEST
jgi:hypothetical protein